VTRWAGTSDQNLLLEKYTYPTSGEFDVAIDTPAGADKDYDVCFTPVGISKGRDSGTASTLFQNLSTPLTIDVKLSNGTGLERRVVVTPNGMARVIIPQITVAGGS
jgi:hypothetical protein